MLDICSLACLWLQTKNNQIIDAIFLFSQDILAAIVVFNMLPFLEKFLDVPILWRRDKYHFVSDKATKDLDCALKGETDVLGGQGKAVGIPLEKGPFEIAAERSVLKSLRINLQLILYREN